MEGFFRFYALVASGLCALVGLILTVAGKDPVMRFHGCLLLAAAGFETYRSGDEYDRAAITHVMACNSHFPGLLLTPWFSPLR